MESKAPVSLQGSEHCYTTLDNSLELMIVFVFHALSLHTVCGIATDSHRIVESMADACGVCSDDAHQIIKLIIMLLPHSIHRDWPNPKLMLSL